MLPAIVELLRVEIVMDIYRIDKHGAISPLLFESRKFLYRVEIYKERVSKQLNLQRGEPLPT